jgi:diguanylate cyclase (GGDEF)-like protein
MATAATAPANGAQSQDARLATAMSALWDQYKGKMLARVSTIEQAAVAALGGSLDDVLRRRAARDAHNLAGGAGTLGFGDASRLARKAEHLLDARGPLGRGEVLRLSELVVELRSALDRSPGTAHDRSGPARPVVIIIDDDVEFAERVMLEGTMRGWRGEVVGGYEAVDGAVRALHPDLMLLGLPVEARRPLAWACLDDLARHHPRVSVYVLGSSGVLADRADAVRHGARGFLLKSLPPAHIVAAATRAIVELRSGQLSVLVVAEDPDALASLREPFTRHRVRVTTLEVVERFWDTLETISPDLLILAAGGPTMDAGELCRVVRCDPRWGALPVVVVLPRADRNLAQGAFVAGADDVVTRPYTDAELIARVTNRVARQNSVRDAADTDPVTGAANPHKAAGLLDHLLHLADRHKQSLCLARVSVDHFRQLDSQHGPAAADAVLRRVGSVLLRALRGEDVVARWASDEFVVAMYGATRDDAMHRLATILDALRTESFAGTRGITFTPSYSAGAAQYPDDAADAQGLLRAAADALHLAKDAGGGRVLPVGWRPGWTPAETVDVAVVEDDEAQASLVLHALETRGYRTRWLRDGEAAAAAMIGPNPALRARLLLLDVGLPALDGFSLLNHLSRAGVLRRSRVIMLTVRADEGEVLRSLELGAVDHVAKPFSVPILMQRVALALEGA